ncbi:hypothetical protein ACN95_14525 [Gordonia sihwensis]|uniref:hypothetical protein n=1 Tax=Gordonia sihwensis TaxID=173559 RepID=UPI001C92E8F7|nr:hypothetical protein [Gordonia sihwensis]MBY4571232.1 hypothetical protein [Gordonia sihwensis]
MSIDKTAMRKAGESVGFHYSHTGADCWVTIEPRTGDRWRYTISDNDQLSDQFVHVSDLHSDATNPLELLRLALNDYREYRGPVREPEPTLFDTSRAEEP